MMEYGTVVFRKNRRCASPFGAVNRLLTFFHFLVCVLIVKVVHGRLVTVNVVVADVVLILVAVTAVAFIKSVAPLDSPQVFQCGRRCWSSFASPKGIDGQGLMLRQRH